MNRLERSKMRKRRRRTFFFSFFICLLIFVLGVTVVNRAMITTIGMKENQNLFSMKNIGQALHETGVLHKIQPLWLKFTALMEKFYNQMAALR